MPTFTYVARDNAGKRISGEVSAPTTTDAARALRREGKVVVSVGTGAAGGVSRAAEGTEAARPSAWIFAPRVKAEEVRQFAQNLSVMLSTGVALTEALETCEDSKNSPAFTA